MTQLTDTPTISATRLLDAAREVTLRLGGWQCSRLLTVSVNTWQIDGPTVFFTLTDHADDAARRDFIEQFALAHRARLVSHSLASGGQLLAVTVREDLYPVRVSASVSVGGA